MAEFYAGGIYYTIKVDDQSGVGVDSAKKKIKGFGDESKKTDTNLKTLSRDSSVLGGSLAALGGTALVAGAAIGGPLGQSLQVAGSGLAIIGSGILTVVPALKTLAIVVSREVIPALIKMGLAAYTALGPLGILAIAITGIAAAAVIMHRNMSEAAKGTKELELNADQLASEISTLNYVQSVYNTQLSKTEKRYNDLKQKVDDYTQALKDSADAQGELEDNERDLLGLGLDLEQQKMDETDAINEWKEAAASGDADLAKRKGLEAGQATLRRQNTEERIKDIQAENAALKEEIAAAPQKEKERQAAADAAVKAELEVFAIKLKEEEVSDRIRKKDFQLKLLEWQKAGIGLTQEERTAFTGPGAPKWMQEAMASIPETITKPPQLLGTLGLAAMPGPGPGMAGIMAATGSLQAQTGQNPLFAGTTPGVMGPQRATTAAWDSTQNATFRDIVVNIKGTVTDTSVRVPASTIKEQAQAQGYNG